MLLGCVHLQGPMGTTAMETQTIQESSKNSGCLAMEILMWAFLQCLSRSLIAVHIRRSRMARPGMTMTAAEKTITKTMEYLLSKKKSICSKTILQKCLTLWLCLDLQDLVIFSNIYLNLHTIPMHCGKGGSFKSFDILCR